MAVRRLRPWRRASGCNLHPDRLGELNGVDPQASLADVLRRIADHPASQLHTLLPWNWKLHEIPAAAA
jgi:hypothetical protein